MALPFSYQQVSSTVQTQPNISHLLYADFTQYGNASFAHPVLTSIRQLIVERAGTNYLGCFVANTYSANNWNNQDWVVLCQLALNYAGYLQDCRIPSSDVQIRAVDDGYVTAVCLIIMKYHQDQEFATTVLTDKQRSSFDQQQRLVQTVDSGSRQWAEQHKPNLTMFNAPQQQGGFQQGYQQGYQQQPQQAHINLPGIGQQPHQQQPPVNLYTNNQQQPYTNQPQQQVFNNQPQQQVYSNGQQQVYNNQQPLYTNQQPYTNNQVRQQPVGNYGQQPAPQQPAPSASRSYNGRPVGQQQQQTGYNDRVPYHMRGRVRNLPRREDELESVSFSKGDARSTYKEPANQQSFGYRSARTQQQTQTSAPVTKLPVPTNISEIEINPWAYIPEDVEFDPSRPYDVFYAPGDIRIESIKYHLEHNEGFNFPIFCPFSHMAFVVLWPDRKKEVKTVETNNDMAYINHELLEELRHFPSQRTGVAHNVATAFAEWRRTGNRPPIPEIRDITATEVDEFHEVEDTYGNPTDRMNDVEVQCDMIEDFEGKDVPTFYGYLTAKNYPVLVDDAVTKAFMVSLSTAKTFAGMATGLSTVLNEGLIDDETYMVLNNQLTKAVNELVNNRLKLEITIDDCVNDIQELNHVIEEEYPEIKDIYYAEQSELITAFINITPDEEEIEDEDEEETDVDSEAQTKKLTPINIVERIYNLRLPINSVAFGFTGKGTTFTLTKSNFPLLEQFLRDKLFGEDHEIVTNIRVLTKDGVLFNVVHHPVMDTIIFSLVK